MKKEIIDKLQEHIKAKIIALNSDVKHMYLYHISRVSLNLNEVGLDLSNINNINFKKMAAKDKAFVFNILKQYMESLDSQMKRENIAKNIKNNKPTGDFVVDYLVTLIKKERGALHLQQFGNTRTFGKLIEYVSEFVKLVDEKPTLPVDQESESKGSGP